MSGPAFTGDPWLALCAGALYINASVTPGHKWKLQEVLMDGQRA